MAADDNKNTPKKTKPPTRTITPDMFVEQVNEAKVAVCRHGA